MTTPHPKPGFVYIPIREWRAADCPTPSPEVMDRLRRLLPPVQRAVVEPSERAA